jgi:hypothetical protein
MYTWVRIVLVLLMLTLGAVPGWLAGRSVSDNRRVLSWKRAQGIVRWVADDYVEIEFPGEAGTPVFRIPVDRQSGLKLGKPVSVYVAGENDVFRRDPADVRGRGGDFRPQTWGAGRWRRPLDVLPASAAFGDRYPDP